jgi:hypothetical protein
MFYVKHLHCFNQIITRIEYNIHLCGWVKLLASAKDTTELTSVERLLCNLTKEEVTNLPRAVFTLSQAM